MVDIQTPVSKNLALAIGALTGLVGLVAMVRLVSGAFDGKLSTFAWIFVLLAMLPWVGYCAWRARHGRLRLRSSAAVVGLCVVGAITIWLATVGPVIALVATLGAFVIIWVHDWPERRPKGEDRFVRIEELQTDED